MDLQNMNLSADVERCRNLNFCLIKALHCYTLTVLTVFQQFTKIDNMWNYNGQLSWQRPTYVRNTKQD